MAKFKNLLIISTDFSKIPNKFFEIFSKDYNEMVVLLRLINTMEAFNNWGKLKQDKSFYLSLSKMVEMFGNNISKPTLIKHLDNLEKKGFISKTKSNNPKQANFYVVNCEKITKLCDTKTREVFIEDEIPQEQPEENSNIKQNTTIENKPVTPELVEIENLVTNREYREKIRIAWNTIASKYETTPSVSIITDTRLKKFKNILKFANMDEHQFFNAINKALSESKFLRGIGKKWRANFDFFLNQNSFLKVIEGAYKDNPNEIMEILQDPSKMSYKEAQDLREKLKMEQWLHDEEEAEEQKALPQ